MAFKYQKEPATITDFGLTPEQEDRAKELHEKIIIFDSLMECSWYDGILKNFKRGGTPTGSLSIGKGALGPPALLDDISGIAGRATFRLPAALAKTAPPEVY